MTMHVSHKLLLAATIATGAALASAFHGAYVGKVQVETIGDAGEPFTRMAKVFTHPRCMNCHTGEAFPRQGDDPHRHSMNVARDANDDGVAGLHCSTCHQTENQAAAGVPGAAGWHLAPARMAWQGLSVGELCRALRDPARGAMPPDQLLAHFHTALVRWAWEPGRDSVGRERTPPPLSYAEFLSITGACIDKGAVCPD